jgi:hypothetical protein
VTLEQAVDPEKTPEELVEGFAHALSLPVRSDESFPTIVLVWPVHIPHRYDVDHPDRTMSCMRAPG